MTSVLLKHGCGIIYVWKALVNKQSSDYETLCGKSSIAV